MAVARLNRLVVSIQIVPQPGRLSANSPSRIKRACALRSCRCLADLRPPKRTPGSRAGRESHRVQSRSRFHRVSEVRGGHRGVGKTGHEDVSADALAFGWTAPISNLGVLPIICPSRPAPDVQTVPQGVEVQVIEPAAPGASWVRSCQANRIQPVVPRGGIAGARPDPGRATVPGVAVVKAI